MYKHLLKPFLFLIDPEKAHHLSLGALNVLGKLPFGLNLIRLIFGSDKSIPTKVFGLNFKNPIGLAAGFDKDGKYIEILSALGFGFIEVGTVTPKPQQGNDKPRLFRLPEDEAIINRLGFNNEGVDALVSRLKNLDKRNIIIGGNIGKNKNTPNEDALSDYVYCFKALHPHVDYFVVNVSSPNTPGLRALQEKGPLTEILLALQKINNAQSVYKPLLLKIAPDLENEQLDDIISIVKDTKIDGLVATNSTVKRQPLTTNQKIVSSIGMGGLSGKPLANYSDYVLDYIKSKAPNIEIIGVGGIFNATDVKRKQNLGAQLVQVYTGFVYEGPRMIRTILKQS